MATVPSCRCWSSTGCRPRRSGACAASPRWPLRRRLEHALPGACLRRRHDRPGTGVRAHRHAHFLRLQTTLRVLSVLPIVTPPFVIGLALILVFGRSGLVDLPRMVNGRSADALDLRLPGRVSGPALRFHACGVSRADRRGRRRQPDARGGFANPARRPLGNFSTVSLPLMRPGLANAFLVGFIESIADFGNPIVLGGDYGVLSTGNLLRRGRRPARLRTSRGPRPPAAGLRSGRLLPAAPIVGTRSYATISGKGDSGLPTPLPDRARRAAQWIAVPWAAFTLLLYGFAFVGGLVKVWGRGLHADPRPLCQGLRRRTYGRRPDLDGRGLELVLDDGQARRHRRAAHRRARPPGGLAAGASALRRPRDA